MHKLVAVTILALSSSAFAAAPIAIKSSKNDRGIKVTVNARKNSLTLRGVAHGPLPGGHILYDGQPSYWIGQGVSFTLDIDKAPTTDVFGRTDYTLKNRRIFQVDTTKGWTARDIADRLAAKVNALPDFTAKVVHHDDGRSTIELSK